MVPSVTIIHSAKILLSIIVMIAAMEIVVVNSSKLHTFPEEFDSHEKTAIRAEEKRLSKEEIRQEMERQLLILQAAEESIIQRIQVLEARRKALSSKKRSHYNSMCMFNVVSCYRKRK